MVSLSTSTSMGPSWWYRGMDKIGNLLTLFLAAAAAAECHPPCHPFPGLVPSVGRFYTDEAVNCPFRSLIIKVTIKSHFLHVCFPIVRPPFKWLTCELHRSQHTCMYDMYVHIIIIVIMDSLKQRIRSDIAIHSGRQWWVVRSSADGLVVLVGMCMDACTDDDDQVSNECKSILIQSRPPRYMYRHILPIVQKYRTIKALLAEAQSEQRIKI